MTSPDPTTLCFTSATELAARIASGEISPVTVTRAVLERIERVDPGLNAFITVCAEPALAAARRAQADVAAGRTLGALHGVPFSVKDLLDTEGVLTTFGSLGFADNVPRASCVAVDRLVRAGAILIGKTTTPELGHKPLTEAPLFGRTVNPWSGDRTCGGSSGGAGAAVAAGLGPLAVGTDGGGSIWIPAAACGVVGMKATLGVVPHDQTPDAFGLLAYIGPMTRTVADAGLMLEVMSGPHPTDPNSVGRAATGLARACDARDLAGLRIGWRDRLGNRLVAADVRAAFEDALGVLADLGARIEPVEGEFEQTLPIWAPLTFSIWAQRFGALERRLGDRMSDSLRTWMAEGRRASALEVQAAMETRTRLYRHVQGWFDRFDLVVTPTLACTAPAAGTDPAGTIEIDGEPAGGLRDGWYPYTHPFNLTGHPALTVPCGQGKDGLPIGLQLIGPWLGDACVLAAGAAFEHARPWADRRPPEPGGLTPD